MTKKIFKVIKHETTVAEKLVYAESKEQAEEMAMDMGWQEKEEINGVTYVAEPMPDADYKHRIVETLDGDGETVWGRVVNGEFREGN